MIVLRDNGVLNSLLQAVGLTSEPLILMNTDFSVILGMTYGFCRSPSCPCTSRSTAWIRP